MGVTYKENIDDIRNSRIAEMVGLLEREGMSVDVTDPMPIPIRFMPCTEFGRCRPSGRLTT